MQSDRNSLWSSQSRSPTGSAVRNFYRLRGAATAIEAAAVGRARR